MRAAWGRLTSISDAVRSRGSMSLGTGSYLDMDARVPITPRPVRVTHISQENGLKVHRRIFYPNKRRSAGTKGASGMRRRPERQYRGLGNSPYLSRMDLTVCNRLDAEGDVFSNANNRGVPKERR